MSAARLLAVPVVLALTFGCSADPDGDGLSNSEEKALGTDPASADSDGDGLTDFEEKEIGSNALSADSDGDGLFDGEERAVGSDPNAADSDGDGYDDFSEAHAGTDPIDSDSVIYQGGWPYNPFKDDIADPGLGGSRQAGDLLPRRTGKDQFGDDVDFYDFANQGKPILLDLSAEWCGPCREMAEWLEGGNGAYSQYNNVRRAVNNGEIIWLTVIPQNVQGGQATGATVSSWADQFPNEHVPVLTDRGGRLTNWADLNYFPSTLYLNENLEIETWNPQDPTRGLAALSQYCSENGLGLRNDD